MEPIQAKTPSGSSAVMASIDRCINQFLDKVKIMNEETQAKDRFWIYVGCAVLVIVTGILMVKQSENEKYAPIKQLADDEKASMNIRVLS